MQTGMDFIVLVLTLFYICFPTLFCQNIVKKICKFVMRVFNEKLDIFFENILTKSVNKNTSIL